MDYEQFGAEYRGVLDRAAGLSDKALAIEVERLRGLVTQIADPADRRDADSEVQNLAGVLSAGAVPLSSPIVVEAERIHAEAHSDDGTPADRIAGARAGMAELSRLAATVGPPDRTEILELNESLLMVIRALETCVRQADEGFTELYSRQNLNAYIDR